MGLATLTFVQDKGKRGARDSWASIGPGTARCESSCAGDGSNSSSRGGIASVAKGTFAVPPNVWTFALLGTSFVSSACLPV